MKKILRILVVCTCIVSSSHATQPIKPNILFVHYPTQYVAGIGVYLLNCSKLLIGRGYNISFLIIKQTKLEPELEKNHIPFHTLSFGGYTSTQTLAHTMYKICKDLSIDIICCNWYDHSITAAQAVAHKLPVKIVFIDHMNFAQKIVPRGKNTLVGIDGILGVSPSIAHTLATKILGSQVIASIPPFFDEEKFLHFKQPNAYRSFKPLPARKMFFREAFGIVIKRGPIICMIANMYEDRTKNHHLLFKAINHLVYKKHKPIDVMLAGDGNLRPRLEAIARRLKIDNYVHFLGFTDRIPELLYYTDFHVLSSRNEAFGIVHIEAGFMKRPTIGATDTGATAIINNGTTGLLFENDDVDDLTEKIEFLIDNPELCQKMGQSAYDYALCNFSNYAKVVAFEKFLDNVMVSSGKKSQPHLEGKDTSQAACSIL
ncbi:MAG: glycosyltransferase family 4 protein [Candidatus Babeliales bacterium]